MAVPVIVTDEAIAKINLELDELEHRTIELEGLYAAFQTAQKDGSYQALINSRPRSVSKHQFCFIFLYTHEFS